MISKIYQEEKALIHFIFFIFETIITANPAITKADNLGVTISANTGKIVNRVPKINPAKTPSLQVPFHQRDNTNAGPKAEPKPPQA